MKSCQRRREKKGKERKGGERQENHKILERETDKKSRKKDTHMSPSMAPAILADAAEQR